MLARLRERRPRVHCITNAVAQTFTANMLLAAGAMPSMTIAPEEVGALRRARRRAAGQSRHLRSASARRRSASPSTRPREQAVPWVLDPVFVDRSPPRAAFARVADRRATRARSGSTRRNSPRSPATAPADEALRCATRASSTCGRAHRRDRSRRRRRARSSRIANGDPLMASVTAMGCAASALVAACLAVEPDALARGRRRRCSSSASPARSRPRARAGPGSFAVAIARRALQPRRAPTLVARRRR